MKCDHCKKDYPFYFIMGGDFNGQYLTVDPECALELTNRKEFKGKLAQRLLEDFREWKEENK